MKKVKQYVQEKGLLKQVYNYIPYENVFIILGEYKFDEFKDIFSKSLKGEIELFKEVCSEENCKKLAQKSNTLNCDAILGFGGGKILDVAKATAYYAKLPCIIMPSSASMDGACSAVSVLYNKDGSLDRYLYLPNNPETVLVDSEIIFQAPLKLFASGMADALSSYYETYEYKLNDEVSDEILMYANHCGEILIEYAMIKKEYEAKMLTNRIEETIEKILYDSCIAFENTNTGSAHVFANATTLLSHSIGTHGERVALGIYIYLLYVGKDKEIYESFLNTMHLPCRLKELHIDEADIGILVKEMSKNSNYDVKKLEMILLSIK